MRKLLVLRVIRRCCAVLAWRGRGSSATGKYQRIEHFEGTALGVQYAFANRTQIHDGGARPDDVVVLSVHWDSNWSFHIPPSHIAFAHDVIDYAGTSGYCLQT